MRLDQVPKKNRPQYILAQNISTLLMHWMSVKLPDNFQMREHSWPCRFHITVLCTIWKYIVLYCTRPYCIENPYSSRRMRTSVICGLIFIFKIYDQLYYIYTSGTSEFTSDYSRARVTARVTRSLIFCICLQICLIDMSTSSVRHIKYATLPQGDTYLHDVYIVNVRGNPRGIDIQGIFSPLQGSTPLIELSS